jgi:hypothetical protein
MTLHADDQEGFTDVISVFSSLPPILMALLDLARHNTGLQSCG